MQGKIYHSYPQKKQQFQTVEIGRYFGDDAKLSCLAHLSNVCCARFNIYQRGKEVIKIYKGKKTVGFKVNGVDYLISSFFSIRFLKIYMNSLSKTNNPKKAITRVVYEKIQALGGHPPILSMIEKQNDEAFFELIESIICQDSFLSTFYNRIQNDISPIDRFAIATKECYGKLGITDLNPAIHISPIWKVCADSMDQMMASIRKPIQEIVHSYTSTIAGLIARLTIPRISEERKQELIAASQNWGNFGWALLPEDFFSNECPDNIADADKIGRGLYNSQRMTDIFIQLRVKKIKKSDLEEAIFCFKHRKYKACSLILFSFIDAIFIKKHPLQKEKRPVGLGAIKSYRQKCETESNIESTFFQFLRFLNVMTCLEAMFAYGYNFRREPEIINRNFVEHGMSRRNVRKKDCIQLFLVLYNLTDTIEFLP